VINLFDLNGTDNLIKKGYQVENLIDFPGHWLLLNGKIK
jgi:adenine phosphoribosyltransferase